MDELGLRELQTPAKTEDAPARRRHGLYGRDPQFG